MKRHEDIFLTTIKRIRNLTKKWNTSHSDYMIQCFFVDLLLSYQKFKHLKFWVFKFPTSVASVNEKKTPNRFYFVFKVSMVFHRHVPKHCKRIKLSIFIGDFRLQEVILLPQSITMLRSCFLHNMYFVLHPTIKSFWHKTLMVSNKRGSR